MKRPIIFFLLATAMTWLFSQEINAQVAGRVTDSNQQPIPQVNITIKDTDRGTQTDAKGKYTIIAKTGDMLVFSHIGKQPVEVRVKRSSSRINVKLEAINIELEGVEIETYRRHKTQKELLAEYPENKRLIKTTLGIIDKDLSSTFFRIVDGKDLIPVGTDFFYSFEAHIPQLKVIRNDPKKPGVHVYLRGVEPVFDVDGFVNPAPPTYLSANDIDRIAVLESNAAIARYGPQGVGGVIVVNTKAQTWMDDTGLIRTYNNRSLADSLVRKVTDPEPYHPHTSPYMDELHEAKTEKQALDIYEGQKEAYRKDPFYFIEAYDFFMSRWGNKKKSKELIRPVMDDFLENVPVLKALAYQQQKHDDHESAVNLYLEILKQTYDQAQSHRDVANAYAEDGDFKKAMEFYAHYISISGQLTQSPFDAHGEDLLITTEMLNILERNREVFPQYKDIVGAMDKEDMHTMLVFEWNNQEAEFELQFVTPDGYFDTWSNKAVLGYSSKQFFIEKENRGLWQVNIDYYGNRSDMPTYLKVSVYHDYGLPSQHIEINVYTLWENHEKVQLFKFQQI